MSKWNQSSFNSYSKKHFSQTIRCRYIYVNVNRWVVISICCIGCFVCVVWPCPGIFCISLFSSISFALFLYVVLSDLSAVVFLGPFHFVYYFCVSSSLSVSLIVPASLFLLRAPFNRPGFVFQSDFLGGEAYFIFDYNNIVICHNICWKLFS